MYMQSDIFATILDTLLSILYFIPKIVLLILSIYYLYKAGKSKDGILILIGTIISMIDFISFRVLLYLYSLDIFDHQMYTYISFVVNAISSIGYIIFTIGIYFLIKKVIQLKSLSS